MWDWLVFFKVEGESKNPWSIYTSSSFFLVSTCDYYHEAVLYTVIVIVIDIGSFLSSLIPLLGIV